MPDVTHLREYRFRDQDGNEEVVESAPAVSHDYGKPVMLTAHDIEIIEQVGTGLCRLGAPEAGLVLMAIVSAWRLT